MLLGNISVQRSQRRRGFDPEVRISPNSLQGGTPHRACGHGRLSPFRGLLSRRRAGQTAVGVSGFRGRYPEAAAPEHTAGV